MPITKIVLKKGQPKDFRKGLMDSVHESLVEIFKIPPIDRNQMLSEFDEEYFTAKPPYEIFIEITVFSGRTKETKAALFKSIVVKLQKNLQVNPEKVFIVINEQPVENWGIRGGISAADIKFDFKINV
jgi:phenylpyruvate tautomerase PptA (4-oxalocrotonate tautomerase family)